MPLVTQFRKAFIDHPASVDETYAEHFQVAMHYSRELAGASLKALVHAFVPGMCCTSASEKIKQLNAEVTTGHRAELADAARANAESTGSAPLALAE